LGKLQSNYHRFVERNVALVAIGPEPVGTARALVRELGLSFPVLADVDGRVIDLFGTRNGFSTARSLIPHPAVVIIDAELVVRFRSIDRNYKKRTTIRSIFQVLDEIGCD
jgi:peroxiredoxin